MTVDRLPLYSPDWMVDVIVVKPSSEPVDVTVVALSEPTAGASVEVYVVITCTGFAVIYVEVMVVRVGPGSVET